MKLCQVLKVIDGKAISENVDLDQDIQVGCSADLMSDILTFTHRGILMSGLTNPQIVRAADIVDIKAIVFVRAKIPHPETVTLAQEKGIPLLASRYTMFETCGRLYRAGLPSCELFEPALHEWREAFENI
jgi:CMP-2-keto-3-deoxyoctulosonic acid synthetase